MAELNEAVSRDSISGPAYVTIKLVANTKSTDGVELVDRTTDGVAYVQARYV